MASLSELADRHANTRFLMIAHVDGEEKRYWTTFRECARLLNSGFIPITDGRLAIDVMSRGLERPLTEQEKQDINMYADEMAANA